MSTKTEVPFEYGRLRAVQDAAMTQASAGKGKERHAVAGEAFEDQQICEVARRLRNHPAGGPLFQAVKKCYESGRLPKDRAIAELLGAMNYIAAAIIVMEEQEEQSQVPNPGKLTMPLASAKMALECTGRVRVYKDKGKA